MATYKDKYGDKQEYDKKKGVDFKEARTNYYRAKTKAEEDAAKKAMTDNAQTPKEVNDAYYKSQTTYVKDEKKKGGDEKKDEKKEDKK